MKGISFDSAAFEALHAADVARPTTEAKAAAEGGFGNVLEGAVKALDETQTQADGQANALAKGAGNLHETALALEKADVAMRLATKVRNKLVDAYNEVMRMTV